MKIKFLSNYAYLLGVLMLFGMYNCQTEPLDSELDLSTTNSSEMSKKASAALDWSCNTKATEVDLLAGQTKLVGKVKVEVVGADYKITYTITADGYCLTSTHLSVVTSPNLFPNNNGNPTNGHFEYGDDILNCVTTATYTVPTSRGTYIAAHAVVNCKSGSSTADDFINNLPNTVSSCVIAKGGAGQNSYFDINISNSWLSGNYDAWCVDYDASLGNGHCFDADVFTTMDDLTAGGQFVLPQNFGAVNWILNQDFISQGYNYAEIQWAIWVLIEGQSLDSNYYSPYTWYGGSDIVALANNHKDFIPLCGDKLGIILIPQDGSQSIIIGKTIECDEGEGDCEETAWGAGCAFPGKNWATYFKYSVGG